VSRRLTREQISALFFRRWAKGREAHDVEALDDALEVVYEAGRTSADKAVLADRIQRRSAIPAELIRSRIAQIRWSTYPVVSAVAARYGMNASLLLSTARDREVVKARDEAAWILRESGLTTEHVALALGRGDHTFAIEARRRTEKRIAAGEVTRDELLAIAGGAQARRAA
jgi:chromosomal replication initiation ATPase DnaA